MKISISIRIFLNILISISIKRFLKTSLINNGNHKNINKILYRVLFDGISISKVDISENFTNIIMAKEVLKNIDSDKEI